MLNSVRLSNSVSVSGRPSKRPPPTSPVLESFAADFSSSSYDINVINIKYYAAMPFIIRCSPKIITDYQLTIIGLFPVCGLSLNTYVLVEAPKRNLLSLGIWVGLCPSIRIFPIKVPITSKKWILR